MIVITVAVGKGGAGKTATAAELVYQLAGEGYRVLAGDCDGQGNLSTRLGLPLSTGPLGMADVLIDGVELAAAATASTSVAGVDVLRGSEDLDAVTPELVSDLMMALRIDLHAAEASQRWDVAVLDTPTTQGPLTLSALVASDLIVATVDSGVEALDQLGLLQARVRSKIARRLNPGAQVDAVVPCKIDQRKVLDRQVLADLSENYGEITTSPVRAAVAVAESYVARQPVGVYAPSSPVAEDYRLALAPVRARVAQMRNAAEGSDRG